MSKDPEPPSNEEMAPNLLIKNLWRSIFWVSFPLGVLSFLLPIYGKDLGANAVEIGALFTAFSIVPAVIRPFLGRALDRWGSSPF